MAFCWQGKRYKTGLPSHLSLLVNHELLARSFPVMGAIRACHVNVVLCQAQQARKAADFGNPALGNAIFGPLSLQTV
jgi:hypothetical protein